MLHPHPYVLRRLTISIAAHAGSATVSNASLSGSVARASVGAGGVQLHQADCKKKSGWRAAPYLVGMTRSR